VSYLSFLIGFEIAGALATTISLVICWWFPDTMEELFNTVVYPVPSTLHNLTLRLPGRILEDLSIRKVYVTLPIFFVYGTIITAPIALAQLLFAVAGGFVIRRLARGRPRPRELRSDKH
jgi:hypothetical protein